MFVIAISDMYILAKITKLIYEKINDFPVLFSIRQQVPDAVIFSVILNNYCLVICHV